MGPRRVSTRSSSSMFCSQRTQVMAYSTPWLLLVAISRTAVWLSATLPILPVADAPPLLTWDSRCPRMPALPLGLLSDLRSTTRCDPVLPWKTADRFCDPESLQSFG